jgi:hypothetical protein
VNLPSPPSEQEIARLVQNACFWADDALVRARRNGVRSDVLDELTRDVVVARWLRSRLPVLLAAERAGVRLAAGEPVAWLIIRDDGTVCDGAEMGSRAHAEACAVRYAANSGRGVYTVEPLYRAAAAVSSSGSVER